MSLIKLICSPLASNLKKKNRKIAEKEKKYNKDNVSLELSNVIVIVITWLKRFLAGLVFDSFN